MDGDIFHDRKKNYAKRSIKKYYVFQLLVLSGLGDSRA